MQLQGIEDRDSCAIQLEETLEIRHLLEMERAHEEETTTGYDS